MDFGQILQQAKMMGEQAKVQQEELQKQRFDGAAGGGKVKAVVSGAGLLMKLDLDKSIVTPDDPEMLGDLIAVAVNDALKKAQAAKADGVKGLTGGMDLSALGIDISKMF